MVRHRILITLINLIFPPLAVLMIAGGGWDCLLNCVFFILAVIPSHVHGFYVTCTYFHRKNKVKKGKYPGGPKSLIESRYVLNGGASDAEVDRLWRKENGLHRSSSRRHSNRPTENYEKDQSSMRHPSRHASERNGHLIEYNPRAPHALALPQQSSYATGGRYSPVSPVASHASARR